VQGDRALGRDCRLRRGRRVVEGHEELIAANVDLDSLPLRDGRTHEAPVLDEDVLEVVGELVRERRGALDVREQEGDGPRRKLWHQAPAATVEMACSLFIASSAATL
jgi:hypothetical protein